MKSIFSKIFSNLGSVPSDKVKHFAVSSIVAVLSVAAAHLCGLSAFWVILSSAILVTGIGVAKEYLIDNVPDPLDLVANYAGAGVVWVVYLIATV